MIGVVVKLGGIIVGGHYCGDDFGGNEVIGVVVVGGWNCGDGVVVWGIVMVVAVLLLEALCDMKLLEDYCVADDVGGIFCCDVVVVVWGIIL